MTWWSAVSKILRQNRNALHMLYKNYQSGVLKIYARNMHFYSLATLLQFAVIAGAMEPIKRRTVSKAEYKMTLEGMSQQYLNDLKVRWLQLHEIPGIFAYQLQEKRPNRRLPGKHGFYAELNADRSVKRRVPQVIESLNPTFNPKQFNFNKVDALEVMMTIDTQRDIADVQMIINRSPITQFHTLICPNVKSNLVQRVTLSSLNFCVQFMRGINDPAVRLGYNSPGALASVNHLHYHLLHLPHNVYIDNVELEPLGGDYVYRLKPESPTEAICFVIKVRDGDKEVREKISHIHHLTEWLCEKQLPHNLFITQVRHNGDIRVFVFVRSKYCANKDLTAFNVGFCEMAGFLPLADPEKLQKLTEQNVVDRIRDITGNAYGPVYDQVKHIINGTNSSPWLGHFLV